MLNSIITAEKAVDLIRDGDTIIIGGSAGMGVADTVLVALEKRFLENKTPSALTIIHTTGIGAVKSEGLRPKVDARLSWVGIEVLLKYIKGRGGPA